MMLQKHGQELTLPVQGYLIGEVQEKADSALQEHPPFSQAHHPHTSCEE